MEPLVEHLVEPLVELLVELLDKLIMELKLVKLQLVLVIPRFVYFQKVFLCEVNFDYFLV